jgi:hypothetical protein
VVSFRLSSYLCWLNAHERDYDDETDGYFRASLTRRSFGNGVTQADMIWRFDMVVPPMIASGAIGARSAELDWRRYG